MRRQKSAKAASLTVTASTLRWRAETLGPDQALADFARGVSGGWASRYWDEHGRLHPVEPPPAPEARMLRQHVGRPGRGGAAVG